MDTIAGLGTIDKGKTVQGRTYRSNPNHSTVIPSDPNKQPIGVPEECHGGGYTNKNL